jgi:hypothetical protein
MLIPILLSLFPAELDFFRVKSTFFILYPSQNLGVSLGTSPFSVNFAPFLSMAVPPTCGLSSLEHYSASASSGSLKVRCHDVMGYTGGPTLSISNATNQL